ncbi:MAG: proton-translocating transhydrogenase family protein [Holosporales bacterium]|jgi:NAD(P) transhydrogenase subunit alpha|nr:proton-translocating transhydrogenase family protein [Holosporales bacterium]
MLFTYALTIFVLACFIGYYVVLKVTPALHSPLMAVTNAISSVIIIAGLMVAGAFAFSLLGFLIVVLAAINIVGGFLITHRMLAMFANKKRK